MSRAKRIVNPPDNPISPGHAAYFSPYGTGDPSANRVTGMVEILTVVDGGSPPELSIIFLIRNVDNRYVCCAFTEELDEP